MEIITFSPTEEAYRYIENAKKLLKENGHVDNDGLYSDNKYIKMAGHTVYTGLLVVLDALMGEKTKNRRRRVEDYYHFLAQENKKMGKLFNEAYNILHLYCGYDGTLHMSIFKTGIQDAKMLIEWASLRL